MTFEEILPGLKDKKNMYELVGEVRKTMSNFLTPLNKTGLHLK
ncbi:methionine--tRNA ligase [Streptococcus pneumoniae GA47283]|nr:methionine--tRNA ligase [Streptococcus pneumoniae GA47283]